jgi:hypothetical protein
MRLICGGRGSGKTARLVRMSADTGATIICVNDICVKRTLEIAKMLNVVIPDPVSIDKFLDGGLNWQVKSSILIDDADEILRRFLRSRFPIEGMALSGAIETDENKFMNFEEIARQHADSIVTKEKMRKLFEIDAEELDRYHQQNEKKPE